MSHQLAKQNTFFSSTMNTREHSPSSVEVPAKRRAVRRIWRKRSGSCLLMNRKQIAATVRRRINFDSDNTDDEIVSPLAAEPFLPIPETDVHWSLMVELKRRINTLFHCVVLDELDAVRCNLDVLFNRYISERQESMSDVWKIVDTILTWFEFEYQAELSKRKHEPCANSTPEEQLMYGYQLCYRRSFESLFDTIFFGRIFTSTLCRRICEFLAYVETNTNRKDLVVMMAYPYLSLITCTSTNDC